MKRYIISSDAITIKPDGGDHINYETFYTGPGYHEVTEQRVSMYAKEHGYSKIFWATDSSYGYDGIYNGDTFVIYRDSADLPEGMSTDAEKYGKDIIVKGSVAVTSNINVPLNMLPGVITYQYNDRVIYGYKKKYTHEAARDTHDQAEGVYYEVFEENGKPINPWDLSSPVLTDIDVYSDGYVGYIWNGRLNYLGVLEGSEIVNK